MSRSLRVTAWNEFRIEQCEPHLATICPGSIHGAVAKCLREQPDTEARTATLDESDDPCSVSRVHTRIHIRLGCYNWRLSCGGRC
jgi:trehalose utilization protein